MERFIKGFKLVILAFLMILAFAAKADISSKVARISFIDGKASLLPGGESVWIKPILNRPFVVNDRLWADKDTKIELQFENFLMYLDENTSIKLLNLNETVTQIQLSQGTIVLKVAKLPRGHSYEISTPNLSFMLYKPGIYKIDVLNNTTIVTVRDGRGEAFGLKSRQKVEKSSTCTFGSTNLNPYNCGPAVAISKFENWIQAHNTVQTSKYISEETIGYQDLEKHGQWITVEQYGRAWAPDVDQNWAPYTQGRWTWITDWGWTWVDDAPWGFAPFHYGRWAYVETRWLWVPGPIDVAPYYAPALVVFLNPTNTYRENVVGWFPLGPGEVYIPPFRTTENYFININITNTVVNQTYITNIYNNPHTNITYINETYPNAVTVVTKETFVAQQPVAAHRVAVNEQVINNLTKENIAKIAPLEQSVIGERTDVVPPADVINKPFIGKNLPQEKAQSINELKPVLDRNPGVPIVEDKDLKVPEDRKLPAETITPQDKTAPKYEDSLSLPAEDINLDAPLQEDRPQRPAPDAQQPGEPAGPTERLPGQTEPIRPPEEREVIRPDERPIREPAQLQPEMEQRPETPVQEGEQIRPPVGETPREELPQTPGSSIDTTPVQPSTDVESTRPVDTVPTRPDRIPQTNDRLPTEVQPTRPNGETVNPPATDENLRDLERLRQEMQRMQQERPTGSQTQERLRQITPQPPAGVTPPPGTMPATQPARDVQRPIRDLNNERQRQQIKPSRNRGVQPINPGFDQIPGEDIRQQLRR